MNLNCLENEMPVAVLGGGSGGHAMAFYLSSLGCRVRWWMTNSKDASHIAKTGTIKAIGAVSGTAPLELVSNDICSVLKGAKVVFVVVPSNAHPAIAEVVAPYLRGDETIILNPGRTAGVVCFRNCLNSIRELQDLTLGETQSLIFTCRKIRAGLVDVLKIKDFGQCAFSGTLHSDIEQFIRSAFPQMIIEDSTLLTSLANIGAVLHPAPVLLNIGRIEDSRSSFLHYYHGITPTIANFLEKIDAERVELADIFGLEVSNVLEWHEQCYGLKGENLYETLRVNERYASLKAPESLNHRYLFEEIPTGLVPMISLADAVGLDVPCMKAVLNLANLILGKDFMKSGRNAECIGIKDGHSIDEIKSLFS